MNDARSSHRWGWLPALLVGLVMTAAACGSSDGSESEAGAEDEEGLTVEEAAAPEETAETDEVAAEPSQEEAAEGEAMVEEGSFPVDIETSSGVVTIDRAPSRIVSLSPTATEMLFAIGAGERVVAVDTFSNYPAEAPEGTLDGFAPDLEAILANEPDVVVSSSLPDDVSAGLSENGVAVMILPAAAAFEETFDQVAQLGIVTGEIDGAADVNADIRAGIDEILLSLPESEEPIRVFHEIDDSFYTATSNSFIGQVYREMGFENIADPLDDGSGFPLVDGESVIAADPTLIVFTSQATYSADDIVARPGWDTTTAVTEGNIVQVDADIASRWGPRIVEFMQAVSDSVLAPVG